MRTRTKQMWTQTIIVNSIISELLEKFASTESQTHKFARRSPNVSPIAPP